MPRRNTVPEEKPEYKGNHVQLVNLSFLPEIHLKRIDDIFDSYFALGMRQRASGIDENTAPMFPSKVSTLNSPELGDTLAKFTAWYSFASDKHKYVLVANNHIEFEMQKLLDLELGRQTVDKGNIETKKSKARSAPDYISMVAYHQKLVGLKTLLDRELANYDKCMSSLSREIARREMNGGF